MEASKEVKRKSEIVDRLWACVSKEIGRIDESTGAADRALSASTVQDLVSAIRIISPNG